jgi:ribosomal protein S27AE
MIVDLALAAGNGFLAYAFWRQANKWRAIDTAVVPKPRPAPVEDAWAAYCRDAEQREAEMYRQAPSAFWLHRDGPLAPMPVRQPPPIMPRCPNCGRHEAVIVLAEHGGEVNMWHCGACMVEFTRKGETRSSRKQRTKNLKRELAADLRRFEQGLDTPHDMMRRENEAFQEAWSRPPMVYGTVPVWPQATMRIRPGSPPLPCGCSIETPIHRMLRPGLRTSQCSQCKAWWEPASNDRTGRTIGQGERVHYRDGTAGPQYFPPARPTR